MTCMILLEHKGALAERIREAALIAGVDEMHVVGTVDDAELAFRECDPQVFVIGPSVEISDAMRLAKTAMADGRTRSVFVVHEADTALLRSAIRAGIFDVLTDKDSAEEIAESLGRAVAAATEQVVEDNGSVPEQSEIGELVTIFSTKGGVGKTVIATNVGVALANETGGSVCLIDLDLEFGDVGIMLGIKPEHTIVDLMKGFDRLDVDLLEGYMSEHPSGLKVLLAPVRPEDAEAISATRVSRILDLLRQMYDFVVVDTSPSFSETVLAALDKSDEIFVVTMMDVASIKNTRISIQKLSQLGYDSDSVAIVLNRADSKVFLEPGEVDEAIGQEIIARIPSDRIVPRSVNKGVPVILEMPKSPVSKSLIDLAHNIAGNGGKEAHDVT